MRIFCLELNNDIKGLVEREEYIEDLISRLDRPDLVVLPELALPSYIGTVDIWRYADDNGERTGKWAMRMASKYSTYVAVGYLEKQGNDYYNSYLIADSKQVYGNIRKSEGESYIFKRGDFPNVIETPLGNIAVAICYDSRRKHFYENIKAQEISLIIFPHGSPASPKKLLNEMKTNDHLCGIYQNAFGVPVIYVNSVGRLDRMLGYTGRMMMRAGFRLNGLSKIYSETGSMINGGIKEAAGIEVNLTGNSCEHDIIFHGKDIAKSNWLFRKIILPVDIKKGKRFYDANKQEGITVKSP